MKEESKRVCPECGHRFVEDKVMKTLTAWGVVEKKSGKLVDVNLADLEHEKPEVRYKKAGFNVSFSHGTHRLARIEIKEIMK